MPVILIVAGPNGAGKTSFANEYLRSPYSKYAYVNADEISRQLVVPGLNNARVDFAAGRCMLRLLDELTSADRDVMFETTLATLHYRARIKRWRESGYSIGLIYLRLSSAEAAIERVARRVAAGGHGIPEAVVRQRFDRSRDYLERYYKGLADEWYVWESRDGEFIPIEAWDQ